MAHPWAARVGVTVLALPCACSLITSYDGFVRDGGSLVDATSDTPPPDGPTGVPQLIGPMSTMITTKLRPTLVVKAPATLGVEVELCTDRACGASMRFDLSQQDAGSDRFAGVPPMNLAPGSTVFWRARLKASGVSGQEVTPTWELRLPQKETATDTAWGSTLDVDGDGLAELAVGAPNTTGNPGFAYVYQGRALADASTAYWMLSATQSNKFASRVASAGDLDGDGLADVLIGEADYMSDLGRAHFYKGIATGLDMTPLVVVGPGGPTQFAAGIAGAGDVDGDGYGDAVVGAPADFAGLGSVRVYFGSATFFTTGAQPGQIVGTANGNLGDRLAGPCDVDGDRLGDVVATAPKSNSVFVYYGNPGRSFTAFSQVSFLPEPGALACADVDGDGLADVIVGSPSPGAGSVSVFRGDKGRAPMLSLLATISGTDGIGSRFGSAVAPVYEVSNTGALQFLIGAPDAGGVGVGRAHLAFGDPDGGVILGAMIAAPAGGTFGTSVAGIGRIAIGAPNANAVYLYAPSQLGSPAQTILAPTAGKFGQAVAP